MTDNPVLEDKKSRNIAVIFAGGIGSRMGYKDGPKQFMNSVEKPIIVYTLERFQSHKEVDDIYISTVSTHIDYMQELVEEFNLDKVRKIVPGGDSAHASIINGIEAVYGDGHPEDAILLIHDGVRPIVSHSMISQSIEDTLATGSSVTCVPAYETVCESGDGVVAGNVLDRDKLYILQAPQCFPLGIAYKINQKAIADGLVGTFVDQANMMNKYDQPVNLTEGMRGNVKITVPGDFDYFNYLVESGKYQQIIES